MRVVLKRERGRERDSKEEQREKEVRNDLRNPRNTEKGCRPTDERQRHQDLPESPRRVPIVFNDEEDAGNLEPQFEHHRLCRRSSRRRSRWIDRLMCNRTSQRLRHSSMRDTSQRNSPWKQSVLSALVTTHMRQGLRPSHLGPVSLAVKTEAFATLASQGHFDSEPNET